MIILIIQSTYEAINAEETISTHSEWKVPNYGLRVMASNIADGFID